MSIEAGQKYIDKDGEVVEVVWLNATCVCEWEKAGNEKMVWFEILNDKSTHRVRHVLTERDFLEQYKPYEVVYEFEYRLQYEDGSRGETSHMTEDEFSLRMHGSDIKFFQRLDFTKRERKQ